MSHLGILGEALALRYLERRGLFLVARNYRYRQRGEIDLIMTDQRKIVFVEVKTRATGKFDCGLEAIDDYKMRKIFRTADHFILRNPQYEKHLWRFDLVSVFLNLVTRRARLKWIRDIG
jgi:putative endonuclease